MRGLLRHSDVMLARSLSAALNQVASWKSLQAQSTRKQGDGLRLTANENAIFQSMATIVKVLILLFTPLRSACTASPATVPITCSSSIPMYSFSPLSVCGALVVRRRSSESPQLSSDLSCP